MERMIRVVVVAAHINRAHSQLHVEAVQMLNPHLTEVRNNYLAEGR